ncbi:MAG: hypothetical protein H6747_14535 [Deltaproteobacteria bacterium]|nr:hypothetical protein [Deltaproteobacteria bacterium]
MSTSAEAAQTALRTTGLAVVLAVVAALSLCTVFVPGPVELGAHLLNDREVGRAQVYLQTALERHGPLREIVLPLAKIELDHGRYAEVLRLLGDDDGGGGTAAEPLAVQLRRAALRESGRLDAYVAALERDRREAAVPDPTLLRRLADTYATLGMHELRVGVLADLAALRPDDVPLLRERAHLLADIGRADEALGLLDGLWQREPTAFSDADAGRYVALLIQLDPTDRARRWIEAHGGAFPGAGTVASFGELFLAFGRAAEARGLLEPVVRSGEADAPTTLAWARAMVALAEVEQAGLILAEVAPKGGAATLLCRVALDAGEDAVALSVAARAGYRDLEPAVALWLLERALLAERKDAIAGLLAHLPETLPADLAARAAHLALRAGDKERARARAERAALDPALPRADRVGLAGLLLDLGDRAAAARELDKIAHDRDDAFALALLWWRAGSPRAGLRALANAPAGAEREAGRTLLIAASGQPDQALQRAERGLFAPTARKDALHALAAIANEHAGGHPALLAFAYRGLLGLAPGDRKVRLALAETQAAGGELDAAMQTLAGLSQPLRGREPDVRRALLLRAWEQAGKPRRGARRDALVEATTAWLGAVDVTTSEARSWVFVLLEAGADVLALPYVSRLAERNAAWKDALSALLERLGDKDGLRRHWREIVADPEATVAARLGAAERLLALGDKDGALAALRALATDAEAESPAVRRLLALWGPRPGREAVAWIAGRAEAATGAERLGWARHLLWVGGARQVLHLLRPALLTQGGTVDPATLEIVLGALADRRDRATIRALADAAAAIDDVGALRQIASLCAAIGERDRAVATWRRVVALDPADAAALRTLAYADVGEPAAASRHWAAYFALPESARRGGSWRERAAYAEALDAQPGRAAEAAVQRRVALRLLDDPAARGEPMTDAAVHAAAGRLLLRLGRRKEAIARLQPALEATPCDDGLRADLTSALMAEGALDKARSIVDPPASCRAGGGR